MNTQTTDPQHGQAVEKFQSLIKDIKMAMLVTVIGDGSLRSRPMATLSEKFDGSLWFFTSDDSPKVDEIIDDQHVGLAYASFEKQEYISVSGTASLVRDREKAKELWTPAAKIWFPDGVDDPHLVLLRVRVKTIEYWDAPSSKMVLLWGLAKSLVTGEPPQKLGDHKRIRVSQNSPLM